MFHIWLMQSVQLQPWWCADPVVGLLDFWISLFWWWWWQPGALETCDLVRSSASSFPVLRFRYHRYHLSICARGTLQHNGYSKCLLSAKCVHTDEHKRKKKILPKRKRALLKGSGGSQGGFKMSTNTFTDWYWLIASSNCMTTILYETDTTTFIGNIAFGTIFKKRMKSSLPPSHPVPHHIRDISTYCLKLPLTKIGSNAAWLQSRSPHPPPQCPTIGHIA